MLRSRRALVGLVLLGGSLGAGCFQQARAAKPEVQVGNPTTVDQKVFHSKVGVEVSYGQTETPGTDHVTVVVRPSVRDGLIATEVGPYVTSGCGGPVTSKVCAALETPLP